jgi:hypothetical protein
MPLDPKPARTDLTDRECAKLIGGLIGTLGELAPLENIRAAVKWWAENEEPWKEIQDWLQASTNIPEVQQPPRNYHT